MDISAPPTLLEAFSVTIFQYAAKMYARYIPPAKSAQSAPGSSNDVLGPIEDDVIEKTEPESDAASRAQPSKKIMFGDDAEAPNKSSKRLRNTENASRATNDADAELTVERKKKEKRQKATLEPEDGDFKIRQRHKSVFEKVERSLQMRSLQLETGKEPETEEPVPQAHGLEPLPQPKPVVFDESQLTYETLPPWLASPIRVTGDAKRPWSELGIAEKPAKYLTSKYGDAFALQTAVIPLLVPQTDRQGDVVVAAPTGSGKTLSYVLPIVQDISKSLITRLRAIILVPTRELTQQVQSTCEVCVAAFSPGAVKRVKIATAVGNRVFRDEQKAIMRAEQRYDTVGHEEYLKKRRQIVSLDLDDEDDDDLDLDQTEPYPYHTISYLSKVDILICTPGRLMEHINKTPSFTLDYVRWLVVDEADKLLAQDFQQWRDIVMEGIATERRPGDRYFPKSNKTGPRKVVLSATMTRDITLLNSLRLSRPRLVLVEGAKAGEQTLPALLKEYAVKIREPSLKPLYLVDLLNSEYLAPASKSQGDPLPVTAVGEPGSSSASKTDLSSDSGTESSSDSEVDVGVRSKSTVSTLSTKPRKFATTALIFTKSNEAALRLGRLLEILLPDLAPLIGTLTSTTQTSKRAQTIKAFAQGKLRVLVASDLVSRGIDLQNLDHVINYDLPISDTSYVHRVGRTARAGRAGYAWTLLEHAESRTFWRDYAGEGKGAITNIRRSSKVERVTLNKKTGLDEEKGKDFSEERVKAYELALEQLRREAVEKK